MDKIVLVGGGLHCKSVIDTIKSSELFDIYGITDINAKNSVGEIEVIGTDDDLKKIYEKGVKNAFITIGGIGNYRLREMLYKKAKEIGFNIPNIVDKTSIIGSNVFLEEGVFVGKGAIINCDARVGRNCIINTGSIVEHDCILGDYVHVSPKATLCGSVNIGDYTHVGANSVIIQNITIGSKVIIGAGSVVIDNIIDKRKIVGNPGREV